MVTVLSKYKHTEFILSILPHAKIIEDREQLIGGDCLIAFSTGVIVPSASLQKYRRAYNFHAASHLYPGRDPHHWASYEDAEIFGATAHIMTAAVDDGQIVGSLLETVPKQSLPSTYWEIGNRSNKALFAKLAPMMARDEIPYLDLKWGLTKRSRADAIAFLNFKGLSDEEVSRRKLAFQGFESIFQR